MIEYEMLMGEYEEVEQWIEEGKEDWDGPFNLVDMLVMPKHSSPR